MYMLDKLGPVGTPQVMYEYARYRAVSGEALAAALNSEAPGHGLAQLATDPDPPGAELDLANAVSALAYLLAGPDGDVEDFDDPLVSAAFGHREVEPDAPTVNDPERVAQVAAALAAFDRNLVSERYDGAELDANGVAPGGFAADPGWLDTLLSSFDQLRGFYDRAAANGWAVVVVLD